LRILKGGKMMKKSSKFVSLLLAVLMAVSCFSGLSLVTASAADETKFYFQVPSDWNAKNVYCHIYNVYGDDTFPETTWQTKKEKCDYDATTGIASYDVVAKIGEGLKDGCDYGVIFSVLATDKTTKQTGNMTATNECYGGTATITGNLVENSVDSEKMDYEGAWVEPELSSQYGAKADITSTGKVVGSFFPKYQPKAQIVSQWIHTYAMSAINGKYVTPESVNAIVTDERLNVAPIDVYNQYAEDYAAELEANAEDPTAYPATASLEYVAELLGIDPNATEEPTTEAPTTEEPTTVAPTTEEPTTVAPTTEEPTTEAPTTVAPTTEAPTTVAPTTEAPTTVAPTTEAPTTVAPTTEEPTTVEPTTVEPTTVFDGYLYGDVDLDKEITIADATLVQKAGVHLVALDALQSALADVNDDGEIDIVDVTYIQKYIANYGYNTVNVGLPYEEEVVTYKYYVAGTENLFVTNWDGTGASNEMTLGEDGLYSLVATAEETPLDAQFKIVKIGDDGSTEWIGPAIGNYAFTVTDPCDVTITFNPETYEVDYSGEFVKETVLDIEAIYAVGNGDGNWLNDAAWDPAADENQMEEVSYGVYTITYTDIDADDNYQVKFAANGTWADSWGGVYTASGEPAEAVYNGDNIIVDVPEDGSTVTLTLDLSTFDYASKTRAKFIITVEGPTEEPTTEAPTTVAPTEAPTTVAPTEAPTTVAPTTVAPTEAPTTEAPTTVAPTTVAPTTVAPTEAPTTEAPTEAPTTEPANDVTYTYYVAGTENLFVTNWDGTGASNQMTLGEDGNYTLVITAEDTPLDAQFKIVQIGSDGSTRWIGPLIGNYAFTVTDACDVTITFKPETEEVEYSGEFVTETVLDIEAIYAVGNGDGNWLNDAAWDPAADENQMEEVSYGVYTITYTDIDADDNYQVKFAANGTWADSWGGVYTESGEPAEAVYNGDNIIVEVPEDGSTVTLTIDLSTFDYASKSGAKFIITVTTDEEPTEEPTEAPTTVAPTEEPTEAPTTVAPTEEPTEAPTTVAPTEEPTEAPTTVAPTEEPTEAPTTEAPTEEPTEAPTTEPANDVTYTYYVAGTENLFVTNWDGTGASNQMTLGEDGNYNLVVTAEDAPLDAQFKIVKIGDDSSVEWIGPAIGNYAFTVTDVCDVTITFNPETKEVGYSGEFVTETVLNIEAIYAVGNGDGNWLYEAAWDPAADENKMEEVSDGVYTITYTDIDADDNYQVKFAANGTWADSWGGVYTESGVVEDAYYNGDNIIVEVPEDGSTVTLTIDLTAFDYASKTGAKFIITVE
jgi:hypothetical protein